MKRERVVVAMSGGVDSSVAAALLVEAGYEVIGITMQLWPKEWCNLPPTPKSCCSMRDAEDARSVAAQLGIPFYVLDLAAEFQEKVIGYFAASYEQGLTPNPCIACNDHIKFGALMRQAELLGASKVATGHYARVRHDAASGRHLLQSGADLSKDQSYVLFGLTQQQLGRALFPIGHLSKAEVRALAQRQGFRVFDKPDSQDICFLRGGGKQEFLAQRARPQEPGPIVDTSGRVLGAHRGTLGFTIGQREGLGIAVGHPLYVLEVDAAGNRLIVGSREELLQRGCQLERMNWIAQPPAVGTSRTVEIKIRAHHPLTPATVEVTGEQSARLYFYEAQSAVTPGQAAVLYDGDTVLGGGWIAKTRTHIAGTTDIRQQTTVHNNQPVTV